MKTSSVLNVFFALSGASVVTKRSPGLPGAVYTCTGENFTDQCQWTPPSTACHIATNLKSLGPDEGGHCNIYTSNDCKGKVINSIWFPGHGEQLPDFGSFECKEDLVKPIVLNN